MPPQKPDEMELLDAVAFLCEVAMVVLLLFAGHGFADGWRGWAIGAFLGFVVMGIWVQWMAPTSLLRLDDPIRLIVQIMLFITVALYAAAGGLMIAGIVFAIISIAVFTAISRRDA